MRPSAPQARACDPLRALGSWCFGRWSLLSPSRSAWFWKSSLGPGLGSGDPSEHVLEGVSSRRNSCVVKLFKAVAALRHTQSSTRTAAPGPQPMTSSNLGLPKLSNQVPSFVFVLRKGHQRTSLVSVPHSETNPQIGNTKSKRRSGSVMCATQGSLFFNYHGSGRKKSTILLRPLVRLSVHYDHPQTFKLLRARGVTS